MIHECLVLFDPDLRAEQRDAARERVEAAFAKAGGKVALWDHWGDRRLAYAVKRKSHGYYSLAYVQAGGEALNELSRLLKYSEEVLRHIIVRPEVEPDLAAIQAKKDAKTEQAAAAAASAAAATAAAAAIAAAPAAAPVATPTATSTAPGAEGPAS